MSIAYFRKYWKNSTLCLFSNVFGFRVLRTLQISEKFIPILRFSCGKDDRGAFCFLKTKQWNVFLLTFSRVWVCTRFYIFFFSFDYSLCSVFSVLHLFFLHFFFIFRLDIVLDFLLGMLYSCVFFCIFSSPVRLRCPNHLNMSFFSFLSILFPRNCHYFSVSFTITSCFPLSRLNSFPLSFCKSMFCWVCEWLLHNLNFSLFVMFLSHSRCLDLIKF